MRSLTHEHVQPLRVLVCGAAGGVTAGTCCALRLGLVPQRAAPDPHRRGAVRERVVDPPDESAAPAGKRRQHVDLPQGPALIKALLEQLRDPVPQTVVVDGVAGLGDYVLA